VANELVHVIDGRCVLYKRANTPKWQVRIRHKDGYWERKTTGEFELAAAKEKAIELYYASTALAAKGIPPVSRKFEKIAKIAVQQLEEELAKPSGKKVYKDYISAIEKYFIPFLGKYDIQTLRKDNRMADFECWRLEQMGRTVMKKSTVNTHNAALKRVFKVATDNNWVNPNLLPELNYKGEKSKRRPTFSMDEYRILMRALNSWATSGFAGANSSNRFTTGRIRRIKPQTAAIRELLRDYVLILANTGIRHGTEMFNMRWSDISLNTDSSGHEYIVFTVNGKRNEDRDVVGRLGSCLRALRRMWLRSPYAKNHKSLKAFLRAKVDAPVWILRNGQASHSEQLAGNFEQFLTDIKMLEGGTGKQRANRTLYSFRHFYATNQLWRGASIGSLETQMGTSSQMLTQFYNQISAELRAKEYGGTRRDVDTALLNAEQLPAL